MVSNSNSQRDWIAEMTDGLPPLVTSEEAAKLLRTTVRNLYRWIAIGRLVAVKHGVGGSSRVLIPKASLVKYLSDLEEVA